MCKYCEDAIKIKSSKNSEIAVSCSKENNMYIRVQLDKIIHVDDYFNINYCPMCGTNLKHKKEKYSFYE